MKIEAYINQVSGTCSIIRLRVIAKLNLGERSEAAKRVLYKRACRFKAAGEDLPESFNCELEITTNIDDILNMPDPAAQNRL